MSVLKSSQLIVDVAMTMFFVFFGLKLVAQGERNGAGIVGVKKVHCHAVTVDHVAILLRVENIVCFELDVETIVAETLRSVEVDRPYMAVEMNVAIVTFALVVGSEKHRECWAKLETVGEFGYPKRVVQADASHLRVEVKKLFVHRKR